MKQMVITCDECGKERKETNHWFIVVRMDEIQWMLPPKPKSPQPTLALVVMPMVSAETSASEGFESLGFEPLNPKHICGQDCLMKVVSRWAQTAHAQRKENDQ